MILDKGAHEVRHGSGRVRTTSDMIGEHVSKVALELRHSRSSVILYMMRGEYNEPRV
jgi:hypothetical protein